MSIQSVLAAGFLFLGGIFFFLFSNSIEFLAVGLLLMLIGILPLLATLFPLLVALWQEFDRRFPDKTKESDKEDNP